MQLKLLWVGRTRDPRLGALCSDYLERLRHMVPCSVVEVRDFSRARGLEGPERLRAEGAEIGRALGQTGRVVVVDVGGRQLSSESFARWIEGAENQGTRDLGFVVGGPEGLDDAVRERASLLLSLGKMTWTHEMARVLVLEQIYRAYTILRGIPYHK